MTIALQGNEHKGDYRQAGGALDAAQHLLTKS
jgi:hypothetical protein